MKKVLALLGVSLFALPLSRSAYADDKSECIAASEKGQQLRGDHKYVAAHEQFLACARDVCPPAVKKDCTDGVAELDKITPTVIMRAKDKKGQDLVSVKVTADGAPFTEQLDGHARPLDPGAHTFRFEAAGQDPIEQKVVLAEGEHDRGVLAAFGGGGETLTPRSKKGLPVGGIILGVVGLVGMGVGSAFYIVGLNQKSSDETGCKLTGGCSNAEINDIKTKLIIGDIAFYGGIALLAGGIIWTIVHYASGSKAEGTMAAFGVAPTTFGQGALASASFRF
jgi:hypothetical protein